MPSIGPQTATAGALVMPRDPNGLLVLVAENVRDIVVLVDQDDRILFVSPSCRALGYAAEDMVGQTADQFIHPDDLERFLDNTAHLMTGARDPARDRRYRLPSQDGGYRWYENNPSHLVDEAGNVAGIVTILRDVHESVLTSEALSASEARYRLLTEHMNDIVVQLDLQGRIEYVSPSVRTLGYTPDELIGHDRSEFIHADEVPRLIDNMAHLQSGVLDRSRDRTHRIRVKDGGYRWFDGVPNPIRDKDGGLIGVLNVMRDIHEAKAAEEVLAASEARYRLLANNIGDVVACYGRDGVITFVTGATEATFGYEAAELMGRDIRTMIDPDDVAAATLLFRRNLDLGPGAPPFRFEYRAHRKDGSLVWLEAHPHARYDPEGNFVEWQDVIRDISGHKALEAQLRSARRDAEAATKTKAEFLADMSHELRGPLSSIAGFARLARERPGVPASVRTSLEQIQAASVDLIGMVNDILDFSQLEAAEVVFRPRPVAVSELARSALRFLEPQASSKKLELVLIDRTPPDLVVSIDSARVRQVLLNLLGNAVKFTHSGRITLTVRHEAEKKTLFLEVRDTGPGIPRARLGKLFHRFTQVADDEGTRTYEGAGLGLAICKGIVEGLGGHIDVESRLGKGSSFFVRLPAPVANAVDDLEEATPRFRILVADPDPQIREQIVGLRGPLAAEVTSTGDQKEAVRLASREPLDIIVADLALARMAGTSGLLRTLRRRGSRNARAAVLALVNSADEALYTEVIAEGFHGVLVKPLSPSEVMSAIAHALAAAPRAGGNGRQRP